ncbi:MAG: tRNA pseudouridine(13) synthase TruD [Candidatus Nitrosocaldus sp.]
MNDGMEKANVPNLDKIIGLEVYSTEGEGIQGRIKSSKGYGHFIVEEIIDSDGISVSKVRDDQHRYPIFTLRKEGIDTIHALKEFESIYGLKLNALGLKDADASTIQYVTADREIGGEELHTRHCRLTLIGYSDRMLRKRDLIGNRFTITIELDSSIDYGGSSSNSRCLENVHDIIMNVRARRVGNFYGYQRFGSIRPVTHLVGKAIVKRRFRDAVDTFLTYTNEYEDEQGRRVRLLLRDKISDEMIGHIPYHMDLERELAKGMLETNDPIRALRRLPVGVRRLFVEAYQAYIFNRALSTSMKEEGYDVLNPCEGDLCFRVDRDNRIGSMIRYDGVSSTSSVVPVMQLVGYTFKSIGRFGRLVESIMKEEQVTGKDFYVKEMQEVSVEGGFRPLPLLLLYDKFDVVEANGEIIRVRFALPKGSYATILLREVIKPVDPVSTGF